MAVYNNGRFSGGDMSAMAKYLNQMNDQLEFVLGNLDSENMTGDYNQQLQYVQDAARSASRQERGMEESSQSGGAARGRGGERDGAAGEHDAAKPPDPRQSVRHMERDAV